ncbi:hypothetical protein [Bacteriophage sp.]|nr:hypothetical protein [Bacteriophage sp.]UOF80138.1 hypothetical protein [Bacteriophage sp.]
MAEYVHFDMTDEDLDKLAIRKPPLPDGIYVQYRVVDQEIGPSKKGYQMCTLTLAPYGKPDVSSTLVTSRMKMVKEFLLLPSLGKGEKEDNFDTIGNWREVLVASGYLPNVHTKAEEEALSVEEVLAIGCPKYAKFDKNRNCYIMDGEKVSREEADQMDRASRRWTRDAIRAINTAQFSRDPTTGKVVKGEDGEPIPEVKAMVGLTFYALTEHRKEKKDGRETGRVFCGNKEYYSELPKGVKYGPIEQD